MISMCTCSRRQFMAGALATAAAAGLTNNVAAQSRFRCDYTYNYDGGGGGALTPASQPVIMQFQQICTAIGYNRPLAILRGPVGNAAADIINGQPVVIYNPNFLNRLYKCALYAPATVLAHEIGHHVNGDTHWSSQTKHPWIRELGADWVSGVALRRLGANLDQAESGIMCFDPDGKGSGSHPDSPRRRRAISDGWHSA